MIKVTDLYTPDNALCTIEIDEYVPLRFRSYDRLLGVNYVRLGNFNTSLLELLIDPNSSVIRGFTLTSFDKTHELRPLDRQPVRSGLPKIETEETGNRIDLRCDVSVAFEDYEIDVVWNQIPPSEIVKFGRAIFVIGENELVGIRVIDLTQEEVAILKTHFSTV